MFTNDVEEAERERFVKAKGAKVSAKRLPSRHPINLIYRFVVIGSSLYVLHLMQVFHSIMKSPLVSHQWFKLGLAASIGVVLIKAYMELYESKIRKQTVEYKTYKNCTHLAMLSLLIASIAFHKALWNEYGAVKTIIVINLFGWGVLLQLCLFLPTSLQNAIAFVGLTFFLQKYQ